MSDLFGNHIVGFPTRRLNHNNNMYSLFVCHFQAFEFVLETVDNILQTVYGLISKAQTIDNSANR